MLSQLAAHASRHGERLLLFDVPHESDIDRALNQVLQYRGWGDRRSAPLDRASRRPRKPPCTGDLLNPYLRDRPVNAVCCDQTDGARLLVNRLHRAGNRRYGIIAGPRDSVVGEERLRGALDALRELGITEIPVVRRGFDYESGAAGLRELAKLGHRQPQVAICANDVMAIGCIDAARFDLDLPVPEKVSVVGFDGIAPSP